MGADSNRDLAVLRSQMTRKPVEQVVERLDDLNRRLRLQEKLIAANLLRF
jgi:hypothetical protein